MSSMTGDWCCTECGSYNAYQETFSDDEVGHIMGCDDCGYYDVYREDASTGDIIEEYQGKEHYYAKEDKEKKQENLHINEYGDNKVLIIDDEGNKYTEKEEK